MQIIDFTRDMIPQAERLIHLNFMEERKAVDVLPAQAQHPPLDALAGNGLTCAAVEDGRLLGFLGAFGPWKPVFCTPDTAGVLSPLHAHAVQKEQRVMIWRRLYQAAGEKWARAGAASHAITLYAHDADARDALYLYGFGLRCMDLMRPMTPIGAKGPDCREIFDQRQVTPLRRALAEHLSKSPSFMRMNPEHLESWLAEKEQSHTRIFAAQREGRIAAFIEVDQEGENHLACTGGTMNICGAYCMPEYRGTGVAQSVLEEVIRVLGSEGYIRLGVDCESFNPTAVGFWSKYFQAYTHSVVRRIDENVL
ncbi:MAG: GNAT family N-acetyltransferase [Clostridia bacterium]|nr:GNAT family N-acetyltransferase [Clostridia bacterium]